MEAGTESFSGYARVTKTSPLQAWLTEQSDQQNAPGDGRLSQGTRELQDAYQIRPAVGHRFTQGLEFS
jgi:hypothetical protein